MDPLAWLAGLAQQVPAGVVCLDDEHRLRYVNDVLAGWLGRSPEELAAAGWDAVADRLRVAGHPLALGDIAGDPVAAELLADGGGRPVGVRALSVAGGVLVTVTELAELQPVQPARPTGREGREGREAREVREVVSADSPGVVLGDLLARDEADMAVLVLRLAPVTATDGTLGEQEERVLLSELAERLRRGLREGDVVCRCGPNRLLVVCREAGGAAGARGAGRRLLALAADGLPGDGPEVGVAMGIALTGAGRGAAEVLAAAEAASRRAEREVSATGTSSCVLSDDAEPASDTPRLAAELRAALTDPRLADQLQVVYQPICHASTGRLSGVEALCRWRHPVEGPVPPNVFIPLAEAHGLIEELGRRVLIDACRQMVVWRQALGESAPEVVSVNVSPLQLADPGFPEEVSRVLADTGLPPSALCLELTESVLLADLDTAVDRLRRLRALGVWLALDDFGSGYSSLTYLHRLPFTHLKIDRSFVADLHNPTARRVVRAIVALARGLGLDTVAEGVETAEQLDLTRGLGCGLAQGYLLGRPQTAGELLVCESGEQPAAS